MPLVLLQTAQVEAVTLQGHLIQDDMMREEEENSNKDTPEGIKSVFVVTKLCSVIGRDLSSQ